MHKSILLFVYFFSFVFTFAQSNISNAVKLARLPEAPAALLLHEDSTIHVLVQTTGNNCDSAFLANGFHINGRFGNIVSLQIPSSALYTLASYPCITYSEPANRLNAARYKNDTERIFSSVDKVQNGLANALPKIYSGKGVIVGIVDIGFQCNNPSFYTSDGSRTRIKRYWQQSNKNGTPPAGFSYGTEFTDTAIIQNLNDMDGTHATHVAAIAAGSGFSTPGLQYRGMAPEADLVFVSIKYSNDTLGGSALGDYVVANPTILDAYKYIFDYAASVGKPAVINLSWGMHTGPHDGTSLFDLATASLVGKGKILVGANGNEGDNPMHLMHLLINDTVSTIAIENGRQFRQGESVYADFWGSSNSSFSVRLRLIDTNKTTICETPFITSTSNTGQSFSFPLDSGSFKVFVACEHKNPNNSKPNITVMAEQPNQRKYAIVVSITSSVSIVHGWNSGAVRNWTSGSFRNTLNKIDYSSTYINGNSDYTAGENGGTSPSVISVGALAARTAYRNIKGVWVNDSSYVLPGHIAKFSSRGPTADGRVKPDISAPGYDIPSAVNNKQYAGWMPDKTLLKSVFRGDTQYWSAFNGTSMAAPHVTGIVALLLEVDPNLSADQVKEILKSTATVDSITGSVPNMKYGYGKVNAYAAVVKALQSSHINSSNIGNPISFYPNPFTDIIHIQFPFLQNDADITILSMDGKELIHYRPESMSQTAVDIPCNSLVPGIYVLRFENGGEIFVWKLLRN